MSKSRTSPRGFCFLRVTSQQAKPHEAEGEEQQIRCHAADETEPHHVDVTLGRQDIPTVHSHEETDDKADRRSHKEDDLQSQLHLRQQRDADVTDDAHHRQKADGRYDTKRLRGDVAPRTHCLGGRAGEVKNIGHLKTSCLSFSGKFTQNSTPFLVFCQHLCAGMLEVRTSIIESKYNFLPGYVRERVELVKKD